MRFAAGSTTVLTGMGVESRRLVPEFAAGAADSAAFDAASAASIPSNGPRSCIRTTSPAVDGLAPLRRPLQSCARARRCRRPAGRTGRRGCAGGAGCPTRRRRARCRGTGCQASPGPRERRRRHGENGDPDLRWHRVGRPATRAVGPTCPAAAGRSPGAGHCPAAARIPARRPGTGARPRPPSPPRRASSIQAGRDSPCPRPASCSRLSGHCGTGESASAAGSSGGAGGTS